MPIIASCACGKKFACKDEHAGMRAKCPACGQVLTIPNAASPGAASPGAAPAASASASASPARPVVAATPAPPRPAPPPRRPQYNGHSLDHWLAAIKGDDGELRKNAAEVLGKVGAEAAIEIPLLIEHLKDSHLLVRHWAAVCLKQIGPGAKSAVEPLLAACLDEQPLIREKAAQALGAILPSCAANAVALVAGVTDKKADRRHEAVENFRRNSRAANVSRCRFWMCGCGNVFEKESLDEKLLALANGDPIVFEGSRTCKKCGKATRYEEAFAGKFDVPPRFWPQLEAKFKKPVKIADDFLNVGAVKAPSEETGYGVASEGALTGLEETEVKEEHFRGKMTFIEAGSGDEGYAVGDAVQHALTVPKPLPGLEEDAPEVDMTPGGKVPETGKYRCTSCGKARLKPAKGGKSAARPEAATIKQFKAGKVFPECPNCEDLTEWQFVPE